ncbi:MAG: RNA methyltransferase [Cyanobacteria bacterium P01_H01_bin.15]
MITSLQNPLVKRLRQLQRRKARQEQGVCLIEGTHLLEVAAQSGVPCELICFTEAWQSTHDALLRDFIQAEIKRVLVSEPVLASIASTKTPDGVIAIAPPIVGDVFCSDFNLGIALERIQDPGNVGTLLRTARATESQVWLSENCADLNSPKVMRASAGECFRVPIAANVDLPAAIADAQTQGIQVLGTRMDGERIYWDADLTQPTLFVLGNEGGGLSAEISELVTDSVRIPLAGQVESLNVAIAGAILLFEAQRQRTINSGQ